MPESTDNEKLHALGEAFDRLHEAQSRLDAVEAQERASVPVKNQAYSDILREHQTIAVLFASLKPGPGILTHLQRVLK